MRVRYDLGRELLKWLAIVTMTIDHAGAALYPEHPVLRYIGRLSYPLFAYLLVLGLESTRNTKNYISRLLLFALISQVPFYLAFGVQPWEHMNIFFTLSSGAFFIYSYEKNSHLLLLPLIASAVLPFDYGIYGILSICCFYFLRKNMALGAILFTLLTLSFLPVWLYQFFALFSLPFILLHNEGKITLKKIGEKADYPLWKKYLFYVYYPLHLLVIYLLKAGF